VATFKNLGERDRKTAYFEANSQRSATDCQRASGPSASRRMRQRILAIELVAPKRSEPQRCADRAVGDLRSRRRAGSGDPRPTYARSSARVSDPATRLSSPKSGTPDRRSTRPQSRLCRYPHRPLRASVMPESVGAPHATVVVKQRVGSVPRLAKATLLPQWQISSSTEREP
jgi:hypothetical protein